MTKELRIVRSILDEFGTLSGSGQSNLGVQFDLIETQDIEDGVARRTYSYGNLRFEYEPTQNLVERLLSAPSLILDSPCVQAIVHLNLIESFTVVRLLRGANEASAEMAA